MAFWSRHPRARAVVGVAIGTIVGGGVASGIAYATAPDAAGVIHACYSKLGGGLRVIDSGHCTALETTLDWNQVGPTGPSGPQGPAGAQGAPGLKGDKGDPGVTDSYSESADPMDLTPGDHTVISRPLPVGRYAVYATVNVVDTDVDAQVGCFLRADELNLAAQTVSVQGGLLTGWAQVTLIGQASLFGPGTIQLNCTTQQDGVTMSRADLLVLRTGSLS
jgi:hypothetical protein